METMCNLSEFNYQLKLAGALRNISSRVVDMILSDEDYLYCLERLSFGSPKYIEDATLQLALFSRAKRIIDGYVWN